jgi:hypothetical protein
VLINVHLGATNPAPLAVTPRASHMVAAGRFLSAAFALGAIAHAFISHCVGSEAQFVLLDAP